MKPGDRLGGVVREPEPPTIRVLRTMEYGVDDNPLGSSMGAACALLNLVPGATGRRCAFEREFAAAQLFHRGAWQVAGGLIERDAVPEVFDRLDSLSDAEFENRCVFGVHGAIGMCSWAYVHQ